MWPFKKQLGVVLRHTKKIKVAGILFTIRRIQVMDFLDGSQVMLSMYETYKSGKGDQINEKSFKKIKKHYTDVLMAGVVKPCLTRDENEVDKIHINEMFNDWDMCSKVFDEIITLTYGKKKAQNFFQSLMS